MEKKIVVIVDSIDVNDSSGSKANIALIANLENLGFEITVFHYTKKQLFLKGVTCHSVKENKWSLNYLLSRTQRVFTRFTGLQLHKVLENWFGFSFTFFNDVSSLVKTLKKEVSFVPDLVLTLSKGASFRPHYALLKLPKWHDKWMAYVHDPYPFHYYPRPYNWVEPGFKQKESFFRAVSEKAIYSAFPSLLLKEWMGSYFPNFLETGVVIPHQSIEIEENSSLPSFFNASKFSLLHAGNLMKQRSPKGLLEGFQLFLSQNPEAKKSAQLMLLGDASFHTDLLNEYKNNPTIYIYNGNITFDVVYNLQKNVSINIILESKAEISPFLPGKFPHCVAANKPILLLSPYYSETKRLLSEKYNYIAEVDDVKKIAAIIQNLYQQWLDNSNNLRLDRPDLEYYISAKYLNDVIISLKKIV